MEEKLLELVDARLLVAYGQLDQGSAFERLWADGYRTAQVLEAWSVELVGRGHLSHALSLMEESLREDPSNAEVWSLYASLLHWDLRLVSAAAAYDQALAIQPELVEAVSGRGLVAADMGDLASALAYAKLAQSPGPTNLQTLLLITTLASFGLAHETADAPVAGMEARLKGFYLGRIWLASFALRLGDMRMLDESLQTQRAEQNDRLICRLQAEAALIAGQWQEVLSTAAPLLGEEGDWVGLLDRGLAYERTGNQPAATEHYSRAARQKEDELVALPALAKMEMWNGSAVRAGHLAERAHRLGLADAFTRRLAFSSLVCRGRIIDAARLWKSDRRKKGRAILARPFTTPFAASLVEEHMGQVGP
jgi:tetratricopeptide (TPR) repeat protein